MSMIVFLLHIKLISEWPHTAARSTACPGGLLRRTIVIVSYALVQFDQFNGSIRDASALTR